MSLACPKASDPTLTIENIRGVEKVTRQQKPGNGNRLPLWGSAGEKG